MLPCPPQDAKQRRAMLSVLMEQPGLSAFEINERVDALIGYADRRGVSLEHCLCAMDRGEIVTACLCVDAPGRMSSVFLPSAASRLKPIDVVVGLLTEAAVLGKQRGLCILQGSAAPEADLEAQVYKRASFEYLTRLIYMELDLTLPMGQIDRKRTTSFRQYDTSMHALFSQVVQGTYEGSLDCVALNGIRDIEDVLASHRGTGKFDSGLWQMAMVENEPAGVILLSALPERMACEVAYMGVLPSWRGKGVGKTLLSRGIDLARERSLGTLTLSVDENNTPALGLYRLWGFQESLQRDIWVRSLR